MIPICIDLETTGLGDTAEILQCSVVNARGDVIFNRHFCPENVKEWPDAERINGISPRSVSWCPPFSAAVDQLNFIMKNADCIIGYNHISFDIPLLEKYGVIFDPFSLRIDMMRVFAPVFGQERKGGGYKWQKLGTMAEYFCFPFDTLHDSVTDCFATLHCFYSFFGGFQFPAAWGRAFHRSMNAMLSRSDDIPLNCEEYLENAFGSRVFPFQMDEGFFPKFTPI